MAGVSNGGNGSKSFYNGENIKNEKTMATPVNTFLLLSVSRYPGFC